MPEEVVTPGNLDSLLSLLKAGSCRLNNQKRKIENTFQYMRLLHLYGSNSDNTSPIIGFPDPETTVS